MLRESLQSCCLPGDRSDLVVSLLRGVYYNISFPTFLSRTFFTFPGKCNIIFHNWPRFSNAQVFYGLPLNVNQTVAFPVTARPGPCLQMNLHIRRTQNRSGMQPGWTTTNTEKSIWKIKFAPSPRRRCRKWLTCCWRPRCLRNGLMGVFK